MISEAPDLVADVREVQLRIQRIQTVRRVGLKEILQGKEPVF